MNISTRTATIAERPSPQLTASGGNAFSLTKPGTKHDPELAVVPLKYLLHCIQCGIAAAMHIDGNKSYWGSDSDDATDDKTKVLLGKDTKLHEGGLNVEETQAREEAIEIIQDP